MQPFSPFRRRLRSTLIGGLTAALTTIGMSVALAAPAQAENRVTPGNFTGYGFDQCVAPTQATMNTWMEHSPFAAVGIYISGDSRACRSQPNLTPAWVSSQLANRWRILPITLGPQASCLARFPRYKDDESIKATSRNNYGPARKQARAEADKAVTAANKLGIVAGSTLWYDLEGFDVNNTGCRESALRFVHSWTKRLHKRGYVSGVYSSASSGIKMLDDARVNRPGQFALPDQIWIARWDGLANTSTSYIRNDGWQPGSRVKQYRGGHNETWGGATINIDSNFMSLGRSSPARRTGLRCRGTANIDRTVYPKVTQKNATRRVATTKAVQCLLKARSFYSGKITGTFDAKTIAAVNAFQRNAGVPVVARWTKRHWIISLSAGNVRVAKRGFSGPVVRRLQRSLTAATRTTVPITGVFDARTEEVTKAWQRRIGHTTTGVMTTASWSQLRAGRHR